MHVRVCVCLHPISAGLCVHAGVCVCVVCVLIWFFTLIMPSQTLDEAAFTISRPFVANRNDRKSQSRAVHYGAYVEYLQCVQEVEVLVNKALML